MHWIETLNEPWILGLLLFVAFIAVVIELFTPTMGLAAAVAVVAFALFFVINYVAGYANAVTILLFLAGVLLLLVEVTIPGFGLPGMAGLLLLLTGIVFSSESPQVGLWTVLSALAISILLGALFIKRGYNSRFMKKIVLNTALTEERGYQSKRVDMNLLGKTGTARTPLRPVGEAEIDGEVYEVLTEGEFIARSTPIEVCKIENAQLFVRRKDS